MGGEQQVSRTLDEWTWDPVGNPLPKAVDVAIIGGGVIGCSTAYFLARQGVSVAVFEKGRIAGEQSGRNWGWVRQQGRSPIELPMMMRSLRIWQGLAHDLGEDVGFTQGGCLYLAENARQLDKLSLWLPVAREHGLDTRLLSVKELGDILHADAGKWAGAMYTASDGRAEPSRAVPAIARGARRAGAHIVSRCAVRGIATEAGRARAVVTEKGVVTASSIVCAGGAWTRLFCRSLGITVPQLTVRGTVARTAPCTGVLAGEAWSPAVAIRRRADGGYSVAHGGSTMHSIVPDTFRFATKFLPALRQGYASLQVRVGKDFVQALSTPACWPLDASTPFERTRMLDPAPAPGDLRHMRKALRRWFPAIAEAPFVETWGGMIETSPDVLPIITHAERLSGFYIATGFSGHGFGIGPGAGRLVADLVSGTANQAEIESFRLSRFFDGSPIRPGPAI